MIDSNEINILSNKIKEILDSSPLKDADKNIHALIEGAFTKMGLVSREEFEVQTEVLQKTQKKLKFLEEKLVELEVKAKN